MPRTPPRWTRLPPCACEIDPFTEPDSDAALLADGWATRTVLRPVCRDVDVDVPRPLRAPATRSGG